MENERKKARMWVLGVLDVILPWVILSYLLAFLLTPTDDCDKGFWDRCGLKVVKDNKTGIEYLITSGGGIIKR